MILQQTEWERYLQGKAKNGKIPPGHVDKQKVMTKESSSMESYREEMS